MKRQSAPVILVLFFVFAWLGQHNHVQAGETVGQNIQVMERPLGETTELWTGALYSSTFRAGMCISATGRIKGALFLRLANGQVDEYHFRGTVKDNHVAAYHSSGHAFAGQLVSPDKVEGRIQLKNGMALFLEGKREQDVELNYNDCSPLP